MVAGRAAGGSREPESCCEVTCNRLLSVSVAHPLTAPKADIANYSIIFGGTVDQRLWYTQPKPFSCGEINDEVASHRLFDRAIVEIRAAKNFIYNFGGRVSTTIGTTRRNFGPVSYYNLECFGANRACPS
jgi:hypothetical protein